MVNISSSQKATQSSSSDLLSALTSIKKGTDSKIVSSKQSFADIVKQKTKEKTHKAHADKTNDKNDSSNDNDQIADMISAIMDILEKTKTASSDTSSSSSTGDMTASTSDSSDSSSTVSDSDTQDSNTPLTFQSQLTAIQNSLFPDETSTSNQSSQANIQNAVNSISGLSDADKKTLTDKLVSLMTALKTTDKTQMSEKDTKSLDALLKMTDTKSDDDKKSSDSSNLMAQIKQIIENGANQPKAHTDTVQQSKAKESIINSIRGNSNNKNLEQSILEALKNTSSNTASTQTNSSQGNISQESQSVSQIASAVESALSTVSVSTNSTNGNNTSFAKTTANTPISIDSLFSTIVDNAEESSGQQGQSGHQGAEGSILATTTFSSIKEASSESSGEFETLLGQVSPSTQQGSSSGSEKTKSKDESQLTNSTQDASDDNTVSNFNSVVQSRNLSMTVKTGDNLPVHVQITRSDDGTATLSLQAADEHITNNLHKTQDVLSHRLVESGLQQGSFKIDILPTDTQSKAQDQPSQNFNQQSSNAFQQSFSGDQGSNSQHGRGQYEVNIGNNISDDIVLQQQGDSSSEMSYNGLHQSLNISV